MRPVPPSPHAHPTMWPAGHPRRSRHSSPGSVIPAEAGIQTCAAAHSAAEPRIGAAYERPGVPPSPHAHPTMWPAGHSLFSSFQPRSPSFQRRLESRRARQRTPRRSRASRPPMRPVPPSPHAHPTAWPAGHPLSRHSSGGWNPDVRGSAHCGAAAHRGRPCVPSRPHPTPTPPRGLPATWIPAFAGMTGVGVALYPTPTPPCGLPATWIPAFAGMTGVGRNDGCGQE